MSKIESVNGFNFSTSPTLQRFRKQFDQGRRPSECNACWQVESVGHKSRRQSAIEFFNLTKNFDLVQLESIDHSATYACNMACVMCGPINSSLWAAQLEYDHHDLQQIGRRFQQENHVFDNVDLSHVKKIHFNGGEPLLNDHQTVLLDMLEKKNILKDIFLSYNTNGSVFPNDQLIDRWQRSRLVRLFFSIDATGHAFEYIRWPGKWQTISDNIKRMRDTLPSNVMFGLNVTVGMYNILEMRDLWNWFDRNISTNREGDHSDFNWQIASNFDPARACAEAKNHAISSMREIPALMGIADYLQQSITRPDDKEWITIFNRYDLKRKTNWQNSLQIAAYY